MVFSMFFQMHFDFFGIFGFYNGFSYFFNMIDYFTEKRKMIGVCGADFQKKNEKMIGVRPASFHGRTAHADGYGWS